jgi:hypothetical protein
MKRKKTSTQVGRPVPYPADLQREAVELLLRWARQDFDGHRATSGFFDRLTAASGGPGRPQRREPPRRSETPARAAGSEAPQARRPGRRPSRG